MNKQVRDFSRAMKIIRNKPVKMLEIKSTAQRIPYMDFSVDLTKESVNIKLKVNRNCPNWNKKRKRSGASKQSIQNLLENIKQSNKSITNLRRERKRTGKHKYFNKTMVEKFSKITKTSNLDPISSENSKQDKYQEKKNDPDFEENWLSCKGPHKWTENTYMATYVGPGFPIFPMLWNYTGSFNNWHGPQN